MLVKLSESALERSAAIALNLQPNDDFVVYGTRSDGVTTQLLLHRLAAHSYMIYVSSDLFVQLDDTVPADWKRGESWDGATVQGPSELIDGGHFVERLADGDTAAIRVFRWWREIAGDFTPSEGAGRVASLMSNWTWATTDGDVHLSLGDLIYGYKRTWVSLSDAATLALLVSASGEGDDLAWISTKLDPGPEDIAEVDLLARELPLEDSAAHRRVWAQLLRSQ